MDFGQELKHSVTTTVNSNGQTVVNETTFIDGADLILEAKHTVSLPAGATYHIETKGDINDKTIKRILNTANNLLGVQAFSFSSSNDAIDTDQAYLTAVYDAVTQTLKGTAPIDSTVRIIFEDDSSVRVLPESDSTWVYQLDVEKQLQFGANKILVVDATRDSSFVALNIEREKPVEPLKEGFTFDISQDGQTITGTVEDSRATVHVAIGQQLYQVVAANDLTWTIELPAPLLHRDIVSVFVSLNDQQSNSHEKVFYKLAAQLDQVTGQYVAGTSSPMANVVVLTSKYGELTTIANSDGEWKVDLVAGLPEGAIVEITVDNSELPQIQYIGPADIEFKLTAKIIDSLHLEGTAEAQTEITIVAGVNTAFEVLSDAQGKWSAELTTALNDGDSVLISTASAQVELHYA
ncbi:hypothetical protein ACG9XL_16980 [Acinetobacter nosocomialis]|uniref:hypothetical protein n=1 Tax=Acinetobacter calcoaceticus/baumannii complex TaxID=909768 RepID=UPI00233F691E|nr:hypothetical protein [Acinetobacter baumannii]MDC5567240.1 hypothetical protein [Acinetobacter baumannii]MDK2172896.1 hypothetical protein [Acinetobacter baumannii]MDK2183652.1 hypothetical protein [Acinetobacter baumannii]MDK2329560.1 hypothetical protein [Acinetobacter baumannii]